MQRFVKSLFLKNDPSLIEKYVKLHKEIPSEIEKGIIEAGFTRMDLYLRENQVVMILECPDNMDIEEIYKKLENMAGQAEWERRVSEFQQCNPEDSSNEKWKEMNKIFSL